MPQPNASEIKARLYARYGNKAGSTRTGGGKNAMRRKKFRQKKSSNEFEKRLQANLKKLSCNTIPGIEEVNLFKSDGTVIHFVSPKVDAEVSSNTFIVSGSYTHNKIEELLPDILPQIGSDHLTQLKDYAEKFEALKPQNDGDDDQLNPNDNVGDDDVPLLIDEELDFQQIAESDKKPKDDNNNDNNNNEEDDNKDKEENNNNNNNDEAAKPSEPSEPTEPPTTTTTTTTDTTENVNDSNKDKPSPSEDNNDKPSDDKPPTDDKPEITETTETEPSS